MPTPFPPFPKRSPGQQSTPPLTPPHTPAARRGGPRPPRSAHPLCTPPPAPPSCPSPPASGCAPLPVAGCLCRRGHGPAAASRRARKFGTLLAAGCMCRRGHGRVASGSHKSQVMWAGGGAGAVQGGGGHHLIVQLLQHVQGKPLSLPWEQVQPGGRLDLCWCHARRPVLARLTVCLGPGRRCEGQAAQRPARAAECAQAWDAAVRQQWLQHRRRQAVQHGRWCQSTTSGSGCGEGVPMPALTRHIPRRPAHGRASFLLAAFPLSLS